VVEEGSGIEDIWHLVKDHQDWEEGSYEFIEDPLSQDDSDISIPLRKRYLN
jgi:hypothetical protein